MSNYIEFFFINTTSTVKDIQFVSSQVYIYNRIFVIIIVYNRTLTNIAGYKTFGEEIF